MSVCSVGKVGELLISVVHVSPLTKTRFSISRELLYATVCFENKQLYISSVFSLFRWFPFCSSCDNMHCLSNNNFYQWHNLGQHFLKWAQTGTTWIAVCTGIIPVFGLSHWIPKTFNSAQTCPVGKTSFTWLLFVLEQHCFFEREMHDLALHVRSVTCLMT